jgi:hypothetical protein
MKSPTSRTAGLVLIGFGALAGTASAQTTGGGIDPAQMVETPLENWPTYHGWCQCRCMRRPKKA